MALLKFISLSVGSLMLLQGAYAETKASADDKTEACLNVINPARKAVGLEGFTPSDTTDSKALYKNADVLEGICKQLKENPAKALTIATTTSPGTAIYFVQAAEDCSAAVDQWKKGFSSFKNYTTEAPPAFTTPAAGTNQVGDAAPYNSVDAVNFATLYSAKPSANAECAYVDCSISTANQADKTLVCVIHPPALENNQQPYTLEQWKGILKVFAPESSSANAAVPTLLALAAAAVGVALM